MILRLREDGDEEVVVERRETRGTMTYVDDVRVSPDGEYRWWLFRLQTRFPM